MLLSAPDSELRAAIKARDALVTYHKTIGDRYFGPERPSLLKPKSK